MVVQVKVSDNAISVIVVAAFCAPVVGIAAAIWTGHKIWLLLIFALALFL
jgi:hypothetical protein